MNSFKGMLNKYKEVRCMYGEEDLRKRVMSVCGTKYGIDYCYVGHV